MVTKEFLEAEIRDLEAELDKARTFSIRAQAVIDAYRMLLTKFGEEQVAGENADGNAN